MTMAAEAAIGAKRHGHGLWVALALSVTLNVFLVGGLVWAMLGTERMGPPTQRFLAIGRSLDLNDGQRAALKSFATTAREASRTLRDGNSPLMQQIWTEMAKPSPDTAAISRYADAATQNRRVYQTSMTNGLLTFLATLSPEQRSRFATLAHHPEPPKRRILRFVLP
jgi:uncharacterized membrane protein